MPFQQYRLKVWFKMENLTADSLGIIVQPAGEDSHRISSRGLSQPSPDGDGAERSSPSYFRNTENLTLDWTEETLSFNSQGHTELEVALFVRGREGKMWWDDVRIDASPTLNVIRRTNLPLTIVAADGYLYTEGVDFNPVSDPKLGTVIWPGNYGTHHAPPPITVPPGTRIGDGEDVYFSGYHAMLARHAAPYASMTDGGVYSVMDTIISGTEADFYPDGYLINYSEIRVGGWEPDQVANYNNTGDVLATSIAEALNRLDTLTGHKPVHVWSDMFNPYQNAVEHYYHVNNTLDGSWHGLPTSVGVMNWAGSESGGFHHDKAQGALQFFEEQGHEQIIAAYYDENTIDNHQDWISAADGVNNITGVMYTTWHDDYSDLELFAKTWWDGRGHQLASPGRLNAGEFLQTDGGRCRLVFQGDGNLVAYAGSEPHWSTGTQTAARGGWAEVQADGNFVVYDAAGQEQWTSDTGDNPGARVVIEHDCHVVIRAANGAQLWRSGRG